MTVYYDPETKRTKVAIGDQVLTPDDRLATVTYLSRGGKVAVETPWSAQWKQFDSADLTLLVRSPTS